MNHPQLIRFREVVNPVASTNSFLSALADEVDARGYKFNRKKIRRTAKRKININDR